MTRAWASRGWLKGMMMRTDAGEAEEGRGKGGREKRRRRRGAQSPPWRDAGNKSVSSLILSLVTETPK